MATYGLLIDNDYCTHCQSCEIACRNELGLPLGQWGIKVLEIAPYKDLEGVWEGLVVPVPTHYCDLCAERVEAGGQPSCVLHCLASCMEYGTLEELTKSMEEKAGRRCSLWTI